MPSKNIPWRHANEPARIIPPPRAPPSVSEKAAPIVHDMIVVEQPPAIQVYAVKLQQRNEPIGYYDAISRPDAQEWIKAMHEELQGLEELNTWVLCKLPVGKKAIGLKWLYKMKAESLRTTSRGWSPRDMRRLPDLILMRLGTRCTH